MAVFKCKICGGSLSINENDRIATCDYCGTKQTLPRLDDEKRIQLYDRANYFRRENEFDKAMGIYEMILSEDKEDYEAYWGIVLCRYGIQYVKDPRTSQRIPTINRSQFTSIFDDDDYLNAIKYSDEFQREIFKNEAIRIDKIQKRILEISSKEEPFDVFICYKETDKNGNRTKDSVYAQDIYTTLTKEGYKVFFSRITLEDKLGSAYEPYIFAALNSAKVMLVVGTEKEHFNAVWVKNEWSRYLSLIKSGKDKTLIPIYNNITPYDMPEEFQYIQSQDMSKIGFMQDLIYGVNKLINKNKTSPIKETVVVNNMNNTNIEPLLKRAFMFLEDGDFRRGDQIFEQVLNLDPENANAYLGKLMAECGIGKIELLRELPLPFDANVNYSKVIRFGDEKLKNTLIGYNDHIKVRNENARISGIYNEAKKVMTSAKSEYNYEEAAKIFETIRDFSDCETLIKECYEKAQYIKTNKVYERAKDYYNAAKHLKINNIGDICQKIDYCGKASSLFESLGDWKDSRKFYEEIKILEKETNIELEKKKQLEEEKKTHMKKFAIISGIALIVLTLVIILIIAVMKENNYNKANDLIENGKYQEAINILYDLDGYKDSEEIRTSILYQIAKKDDTISAGYEHTVGLKSDGTVVAVGDNEYGQCDVDYWTDIVAISAGRLQTVGLKSDGTVVAVGDNDWDQCDVDDWTDIVAISAGTNHTVGLKSNGTVVAVGTNGAGQCDVDYWTDIVAISAGFYHTVGLKSDGTVVAVGDNSYGRCNVDDWTDIVAISTGYYHAVGLKSDGTVVAVGDNEDGQCDVDDWTDIVAISTGYYHTVGLKSDGTVVAVGDNDWDQCDVDDWTDIVAISAGDEYTLGLKSDGTVVAVGGNYNSKCDVDDWKNIKIPE